MTLSGSSRTAGGYGLPLSLALAASAVALLVVFFVVPLSTLLRESLESPVPGLQNYAKVLTSDLYLMILWRTVRLAGIVAALTLILGYPVALTLSRLSGRMALLLTLAVMIPSGPPFWCVPMRGLSSCSAMAL